MGGTLEAIGDRLSPERMVERRKAAVGQTMTRMRERVMGSPGYQEPITQRMRERAEGMASSASETARSAAERVQQAPEMVANQARGNPIAAGVVAFGLGALFASAFPRTETEQHLLDTARPQLDNAKRELREAGRDMAAEARDEAKSAAQEVTEASKQAASTVADEAKSSAQTVAQETRS
jgi:hypothetical protein